MGAFEIVLLDPTFAPKVTDDPFTAEDMLLLLEPPVMVLLRRLDPAAVKRP